MDIQVASNFERLLYDLYDKNSQNVINIMRDLIMIKLPSSDRNSSIIMAT